MIKGKNKLNMPCFVLLMFLMSSCSEQVKSQKCSDPNTSNLIRSLSSLDAVGLAQFFESKYCKQHEEDGEFYDEDSTFTNVMREWVVKSRVDFIEHWTLFAKNNGRPLSALAQIKRYQSYPESIAVKNISDLNYGRSMVFRPPPDYYLDNDTLRFIVLSAREEHLIDSLIRKVNCNEWNDSCYIPERKTLIEKFINIKMKHWGEGTYCFAFPMPLQIVMDSSSGKQLIIRARTHVGIESEFRYTQTNNSRWIYNGMKDVLQE